MEMGLSLAEAASRLNMSRSVVQRLWNQFQTTDSVSRRPVPGRPRVMTLAEDRYLELSAQKRRTTAVSQLIADHFVAKEEGSQPLQYEDVFIMQECMQDDHSFVSL